MSTIATNRQIILVAAFTALGWLGEYLHNLAEVPDVSILSPQNSLTALVSALLFMAWWLLPYKRPMAWLLILWAVLHLIGGGIISVIPFSFLPFYPEQSVTHYLVHLFYGAAQLPLIAILAWELRRS